MTPAHAPAPAARLTIGGFGVGVTLTDTTGLGVAARVVAAMPPELVGQEAGADTLEYVIRLDSEGGVAVTRDGEAACEGQDPAEAVRWLCSDIDFGFASRATGGLFVHAGVVAWRGHAIVIPGRSGTGKTHLVAELVRRGAVYYSDEFAVIDEDGRVHPYARVVPLGEGSGDRSDRVLLEASIAPQARPPLSIALIAAVTYRPRATWEPTVRTGARSVLPLIDNTIVGQTEPERALAMARRLAPDVVTLSGARPDATAMAGDLLERLDAIIDGTAAEPADQRGWNTRLESIRPASLSGAAPAEVGPRGVRYTVLRDFLSTEDRDLLITRVLERAADFQASKVLGYEGKGLENHESRRSRVLYDLDGAGPMFERATGPILPYLRRELGMAWFAPLTTEVQVTVHENGSYFKPHRDLIPTAMGGRRLTCVYYFSITPDFDGGELILYDAPDGRVDDQTPFVVVPPTDNSLVCFPSDQMHEVRPVVRTNDDFAGNRFAVSVWLWDSGFLPWGGTPPDRIAAKAEVTAAVG